MKKLCLVKRYDRYDHYTDSGVAWLGQVPEEWVVISLSKYSRAIGSGTTPASSEENNFDDNGLSWVNTGDLNDGLLLDVKKRISKKALISYGLKMYPKGSLIIAMYGATIGKLGILGIDATVNQACCVIQPGEKIDTKFIFYYLLGNKKEIINMAYGGGQPNINQDLIKKLSIVVPPISTQQKIATYLDEKTAIIDAMIEKKQRMMELLEEKRKSVVSGAITKYTGNNVSVQRLKFVAPLRNIKIETQRIGESYIGMEHVSSWRGVLLNIEEGQQEAEGIVNQFKSGDVLFGKLRPYLAKGFVAEFDGVCSGEFLVMVSDQKKILPKYLLNIILSEKFIDMVDKSTYGAKMPRASWDFIGNIEIQYPSLEKQQQIITHIDETLKKIDDVLCKLQESINLLNEYKTSLISHVVMGRIKI
jgi:type I restriction enzyme, S subunit